MRAPSSRPPLNVMIIASDGQAHEVKGFNLTEVSVFLRVKRGFTFRARVELRFADIIAPGQVVYVDPRRRGILVAFNAGGPGRVRIQDLMNDVARVEDAQRSDSEAEDTLEVSIPDFDRPPSRTEIAEELRPPFDSEITSDDDDTQLL